MRAEAETRETPEIAGLGGQGKVTRGLNGVPIGLRGDTTHLEGYRTYEVHQRQRVHQSTEKIKPIDLISAEYLANPYPPLAILRENYPCYRDWLNNAYWVTRYDDATSIFVDDANFETRSKLWFYTRVGYGRDLRSELAVLEAEARRIDAHAKPVAEAIVAGFERAGEVDLAVEFAARYPLELLARVIDLPAGDFAFFVENYWKMQRGFHWEPRREQAGLEAIDALSAYFDGLIKKRRANPGDDLVSAIASLAPGGQATTGRDVTVTLLEGDHETLHGALANMWFLLLTHPDQLDVLKRERRLVKFAYLEAMRHSAPVLTAWRFARHEVERFGLLLPEGALVLCSAAAGNRDPRIYRDPDRFIVGRKDLCQREPRGHYRADGLPAGIAFGLGKPSRYPALPEDRPRSRYAITRDTVVAASNVLLDRVPKLRLKAGAAPQLRALAVWEMHTCWSLPVQF